MSVKQELNQVLEALGYLGEIDTETYKSRIQDLINIGNTTYGQKVSGQLVGGQPVETLQAANDLKIQTIAVGVSVDGNHGFSNYVNKAALTWAMAQNAKILATAVYQCSLDDVLQAHNCLSVQQMMQSPDFCRAFVENALSEDFINDALIYRVLNDNPYYTEAIAYLYERFRSVLLQAPDIQPLSVSTSGGLQSASVSSICSNTLTQVNLFSATVSSSQALSDPTKRQQFLSWSTPIEWTDEPLLQGPQFARVGNLWLQTWSSDPYANELVSSLVNEQVTRPVPKSISVWIYYGPRIYDWIVSQSQTGYGELFQNVGPVGPRALSSRSGSCFATGTLITTEHGDVHVEDLRPYTRVLVRAPELYGMTSEEIVVHPTSHSDHAGGTPTHTLLYGFNGGKPFVTAGHIFLTVMGPKAIDPEIATQENPHIYVSRLQIGDILLRLNASRKGYDHVRIASIIAKSAHCTTVHGVHFLGGSSGGGKYHANGYWVAANYPELTMSRLIKQYETMNMPDRVDFVKRVANLPSSFRTVLGDVVSQTVQRVFSDITPESSHSSATGGSTPSLLERVEKASSRHVSVKSLHRAYNLLDHNRVKSTKRRLDTTSPQFLPYMHSLHKTNTLTQVSVCNGAVTVDGKVVDHASMTHSTVRWSRPLDNAAKTYEHGVLRSLYHGQAAVGYTAVGPAEVAHLNDFHSVKPVLALPQPTDHKVAYSDSTFTDVTTASAQTDTNPSDWKPFWDVQTGVELSSGSDGISITVSIPLLDSQWAKYQQHMGNKSSTTPYSVGVVSAGLNSTMVAPVTFNANFYDDFLDPDTGILAPGQWTWPSTPGPGFCSFVIILDLKTSQVNGYYYEAAPVGLSYQPGPIHALASAPPATLTKARLDVTTQVLHKSMVQPQYLSADLSNPTASVHQPALPATTTLATKLFSVEDLSITDLQLLGAPSSDSLNRLAQQYMQNASTWNRLQPEIDVFGDEKAAVVSALPKNGSLTTNLSTSDQNWLGKYNRAQLLQALQRDNKYTSKFTAAQTDQLAYYYQGSQKGCLAQDPQFSTLSGICAGQAYVIETPGLEPYMEADPDSWALQFYSFLISDDQLNNQAYSLILNTASGCITNTYCMTLDALDTKGIGYSNMLWGKIQNCLLVGTSNQLISASPALPYFMAQFVQELIDHVMSETGAQLETELKVDIETIMNALNNQNSKELGAVLFGAQSELGACFYRAVSSAMKGFVCQNKQATLSRLMAGWTGEIAKLNSPNGSTLKTVATAATSIVALATDAFALYSSVEYFLHWDSLSTLEQAQAILSCLQTVLQTCKDFAGLIKTFRGLQPGSYDFRMNCANWNKGTGSDTGRNGSRVTETDTQVAEQAPRESVFDEAGTAAVNQAAHDEPIAQTLAATARDPALEEGLVKTFSVTEAVGSVISIATNVVSAVSLGLQIKNDFEDDQPANIKAMDILSEVVTDLQIVSTAVELGLTVVGVECAAVPVIGVVIAIAGIVLMFCEMFVHRNNPNPDPVGVYIGSYGPSFIGAVPQQPSLTLKYSFESTTVPCNASPAALTITITNPSSSSLHFQSIAINLPAGDAATALFATPKTVNGVTSDPITATVNNAAFKVNTPLGQDPSTGAVVARLTAVNNTGSTKTNSDLWPQNGLTLTLTGTVNATAGTAQIMISEAASDRSTGISNADYYAMYDIVKQ